MKHDARKWTTEGSLHARHNALASTCCARTALDLASTRDKCTRVHVTLSVVQGPGLAATWRLVGGRDLRDIEAEKEREREGEWETARGPWN